MASKNDAVFDFAAQVVGKEVVDRAGRDVEDIRRELVKRVSDYVDAFYTEMLFEGSFSGSTGLPLYSKHWKDLAGETIYRKGHDRYLEDSGELMDNLLARSPLQDFGKPTVGFSGGQREGGAPIFIDRAGRPQYAAGSGKRGFAKFSDLKGLSFTLTVEAFPRLRGQNVDNAIRRMTSGFDTLKLSMFERGRKHQPARPLVRPFLAWYATTGLELQIQKITSGRSK